MTFFPFLGVRFGCFSAFFVRLPIPSAQKRGKGGKTGAEAKMLHKNICFLLFRLYKRGRLNKDSAAHKVF